MWATICTHSYLFLRLCRGQQMYACASKGLPQSLLCLSMTYLYTRHVSMHVSDFACWIDHLAVWKGHWSTCGKALYLCGPAPTGHMLPMFKTHQQDRARHWTLLLITCDEKCKLYRVIRGELFSSCVVTFPLETIFVAASSLFIIRLYSPL